MKQFLKQHKYPLILFILFLMIAILSWSRITNYQLPIINQFPISNYQNTTTTSEKNAINIPVVQSVQVKQIEQAEQLNNLNNNPPQITSYKLQVTSTSTVYELMKNSPINFKSKTFSGMGEFVEEINGLKNDVQTGKYWIYYINGKSAKLGVSTQIVKPNDLITWKYENANF